MFMSSICKHVNKWGKNKGYICGKNSRKKDSRCHKHRYRFLHFINRIYISFKYLFDIKPKIIINKNKVKRNFEENEKKKFQNNLDIEKEREKEILKMDKKESFRDYVNRIDIHTDKIIKEKDKNILNKLIMDSLYSNLNRIYCMGTRDWTNNANIVLKIQRKYDFF